MVIIPIDNGYLVTNGVSIVRTFTPIPEENLTTCRVRAVTFAMQAEQCYPKLRVIHRKILL